MYGVSQERWSGVENADLIGQDSILKLSNAVREIYFGDKSVNVKSASPSNFFSLHNYIEQKVDNSFLASFKNDVGDFTSSKEIIDNPDYIRESELFLKNTSSIKTVVIPVGIYCDTHMAFAMAKTIVLMAKTRTSYLANVEKIKKTEAVSNLIQKTLPLYYATSISSSYNSMLEAVKREKKSIGDKLNEKK